MTNYPPGIKDILNRFDDEHLFALGRTVTQGLLKKAFTSREDAIDIILKYSPNEVSILRRRAVTREVLFSYLHDLNCEVPLPITKDQLIDLVCSQWKVKNQEIEYAQVSDELVPVATHDEHDVNSMAKQFSGWFYEMINMDEVMDTSHFYVDANIELNMTSPETALQDEAFDPESIVQLLYKTKTEHNLYFNPNLNPNGVHGIIDHHGLVLIYVCGTLHSGNACVGVFEQTFSLARDPYCENNWKIKTTKMNLRSQTVQEEPTLAEDLLQITEC